MPPYKILTTYETCADCTVRGTKTKLSGGEMMIIRKNDYFYTDVKLIKPVVIILLCSLSASSIYCQAQNNPLDYINGKFIKYCQSVPWEEVYIHTDREEYIAGEELWFNVYLIDRQTTKPSTLSKIVYVEILNPDNHPVAQKRIEIETGYGPDSLFCPTP